MSAIAVYNIATGVATAVTTAFGIASIAAAAPWILLASVVIGVAAAIGIASGAMDGMTQKFNSVAGLGKTLQEKKDIAASALAPIPTEITNSDPISVKGNVEIKEESIKAMIDLAGYKYIASFSNVTPQLVVQNANISEKADMNMILEQFGEFISAAAGAQPEGMPA